MGEGGVARMGEVLHDHTKRYSRGAGQDRTRGSKVQCDVYPGRTALGWDVLKCGHRGIEQAGRRGARKGREGDFCPPN
eukprot:5638202-Prymnesium_polylepis.1